MEDISARNLLTIMFQYLDKEKLIKENPSVTKEMIDSLIQTISNPESTTKTDYIDFRSPDVQHKKTGKFNELIIYTDGASRGNPGKAGIGVAILDKDNHVVEELCRFIGRTTNNVAEYRAMILAAQKAIEYHAKKVIFKTDSELLVRQLNGIYQVKSPNILPLYHELMALLRKIPDWEARHVFREKNARADALANRGIDSSGPN